MGAHVEHQHGLVTGFAIDKGVDLWFNVNGETPSGSPCLGGEKASPKQGRLEGSTHLYVSLRCMNIESDRYRLYAGGGLLKDSTEEQEWLETEAKLETMRRCIAISKA